MAAKPGTVYVATAGFHAFVDGQEIAVQAGDLAREGHPILEGRKGGLFEPAVVRFDVAAPISRSSKKKA